MLRRSTIAGLVLLMAGALIFAGCSSSSTDANNNMGDPDSPAFQAMKSAIAMAIDSTIAISLDFTFKPDRYPNDGNVGYDRPELGPNDSLLYNYVDNWHVLIVGGTSASNYQNTYVDSARYWEGSETKELFRWDRVTKLELIHHQSTSYTGSSSEYNDVEAYVNMDFDNWGQADQMFSGEAHVMVDMHYLESLSPQNDTYEFDIVAEDVVYSNPTDYSWTSCRALDGSMTITGTVTADGGVAEWSVEVEFMDGTASITAQQGEMVYHYNMTPEYN